MINNYDNIFIIERKGEKIKDEKIYNEGQFVRIKLIKYKSKIYWIKKINGIIEDFQEVGENAATVCMD